MKQESINPKLAYSVEEASSLLSVSRAHLYRLLDSGEMKSIHIGRSRRITQRQLDNYLAVKEAAAS
jgi:excisionase family DNA binding protein